MRCNFCPRTIEELLKHKDGPQPIKVGSRYYPHLERRGLIRGNRTFKPQRSFLTAAGRRFIDALQKAEAA